MKKAGNEIVERVKELLGSDEGWRWEPKYLDNYDYKMTVRANGNVCWWQIGDIPLDWTQRRSVARAFKKAHARITAALVRKGQQATP